MVRGCGSKRGHEGLGSLRGRGTPPGAGEPQGMGHHRGLWSRRGGGTTGGWQAVPPAGCRLHLVHLIGTAIHLVASHTSHSACVTLSSDTRASVMTETALRRHLVWGRVG